jgi:hypothetical protein
MKSGGETTASGSGSLSQSNRERSCSSWIATSPSSTRERADSFERPGCGRQVISSLTDLAHSGSV